MDEINARLEVMEGHLERVEEATDRMRAFLEARDLQAAGLARRDAQEALRAAGAEWAVIQGLMERSNPEPPLADQNLYSRRIAGRLTAHERRAELERQIDSGEIPAQKADEFRRGLELEFQLEGQKALKRQQARNRALAALASN